MYRKLVAVLAVVLLAAVTACAGFGGGAGPDAQEPVTVGAIFDLTGATSDVGQPYAEGVRGYVNWLNENGGVEGRQVELLSEDYAYEVPRAETLYEQFVGDGAVVFMGWGTGDTEALRSKIAQDQIPFMSASYSHVLGDPEEAPYNFLVGTSYSDQFFIALDWIMEDWQSRGESGAPTVALMHHPSPFGESPWRYGGEEYANELGIEAQAFAMPSGAPDFTAELSRIQDFGAQYIVFQTVSSPAAQAVQDARGLGMDDVTMVCLNWCADEILVELAGNAAEGAVGVIPFTPPTVDVPGFEPIREYVEAQGSTLEEETLHYPQGWVTMQVMIEGVRRVLQDGNELTGENIKAALETVNEYETGGITAPVTFSSEEHYGTKALRLYQVQDGQWTQLTDFRSVE